MGTFLAFFFGAGFGALALYVCQNVFDPQKRLRWLESQLESRKARQQAEAEQHARTRAYLEQKIAQAREKLRAKGAAS